MLVGPTGGGKTVVINTLAQAQTKLGGKETGDGRKKSGREKKNEMEEGRRGKLW